MQTLLEQLQKLALLAAAATAGPWVREGDMACAEVLGPPTGKFAMQYPVCSSIDDEDAAFIVAVRNVLTPENLTLLVAGQAALAAAAPQWVSVAERLPEAEEGYTEFSTWVLAYTMAGRQIEASYYFKGPLKGWHTPTGKADVTHWMPLPTARATMEGASHA
ncbi:DUF551 domain-containing protein [Hymenobacter siberiensis]|uniref:DUF551 domain-containing protein n=1 Tax=Hymenobacter siberiensis TaxID=2848396 RepID=UPI001C1E7ECC|nr:DUF551 domain-containing protein [Hymenobacter siberiensis]